MPLLSTFGAASARGFGNLSGIALPSDNLFNTVSALLHFDATNNGVNNVFDDSSTSNHTITVNGNVTQGSFGPFARPDGEWAVSFDGSGDRLRTNAANLDVTTEAFTAEAWIFPSTDMDQYDIIACLFDLTHGSNANQTWSIRAGTSNTVEMITVSGGTQTILSAGTVNIGEWNHVAISRNGTTMYASLNGTVTSASCASSLNGHEYFYIGAADAGGSASYFFNGFISNVRYEIGNARYTSSYTPPSSALTATANTKLLTCQSNRFVDNSTSAHTIRASGNPDVSAFGPFLTSEVYDAGVNGASAYFDGTGDYLTTPGNQDFNLSSGDWTIDGWINNKVIAANNRIFSIEGTSNTYSLIRPNSNPIFDYNHVGSGSLITTSNNVSYAGEWTHFALVSSGGTITLWINGVSEGTTTTYPDNSDTQITVAASVVRFATSNTNAYISNLRVVKGTAVYTSAFTPPTAPTTAITNTKLLLNMADGQAIDSAAQNTLTLYGDAKISSTQSKFGGTSLALDGTGDYATLPPKSLDLGAGNFTLESWVYTTVTGQRCIVGATKNQDGTGAYMMNINYNGAQVRFFCRYNGGTALSYNVGSGDFPTNAWTHLAVTRDGANLRVFIDGTQVGTTNTTLGSFSIDNASLNGKIYYIGRTTDGASQFTGFLDSLRVSKTARYTSNFIPPTEPFADKGQ